MNMKIQWKYFILFFLLFAVLGYVREKFFVALNHLIYVKYYGNTSEAPIDPFILVLNNFSYTTLYYLKYPATLLSFLLFAGLSLLTVHYVLNDKKLLKWVIYSYAILLTLAALSMLFGYFINNRLQDDEYTLSRWLMGIAQSPIIAIVLIASYQLYNQTKTNTP